MLNLVHEVIDRQVPTAEELRRLQALQGHRVRHLADVVPRHEGRRSTRPTASSTTRTARPTSMHLVHEKMNAKRYRKLRLVRDKYSFYRRYGAEKADVGIVCWGSSKGPVKEAVLKANAPRREVSAFVPQLIMPFPKKASSTSSERRN
jgi:pyruvate/2-oxoacid:ferredoxin oxidoreductase alpha subunit